MFNILRQVIVLTVVAAGSIVFWETSEVRRYFFPAERPPGDAPAAQAVPAPRAEDRAASEPLVPGSAGQRLVAWALFVLLLPVVTAAVAARVFEEQSNTANLVLLFGYTGLDVLAAWLVGGLHIGGLVSGIAYLIALLAVFTYNAWICGWLAKMREE